LGVTLSEPELELVLARIKSNAAVRHYRDVDLLDLAEEVTGKKLKPRPPENVEALVSVKCDSNIYTSAVRQENSLS